MPAPRPAARRPTCCSWPTARCWPSTRTRNASSGCGRTSPANACRCHEHWPPPGWGAVVRAADATPSRGLVGRRALRPDPAGCALQRVGHRPPASRCAVASPAWRYRNIGGAAAAAAAGALAAAQAGWYIALRHLFHLPGRGRGGDSSLLLASGRLRSPAGLDILVGRPDDPFAVVANQHRRARARWILLRVTEQAILNRRPFLAALGCAVLLTWMRPAQSSGTIEVEQVRLDVSHPDDLVLLSADFVLSLTETLQDAVNRGLRALFPDRGAGPARPLVLVRTRPWSTTQIEWRLSYHALTRQFRVATNGRSDSFGSLEEALAAMSSVKRWPVAPLSPVRARDRLRGLGAHAPRHHAVCRSRSR